MVNSKDELILLIKKLEEEGNLESHLAQMPSVEDLLEESPNIIPQKLRPKEFRKCKWEDPDYFFPMAKKIPKRYG